MSEPTGTGADTLDTLQTEVTPSITSALTETSADPSRTLTTGVTLDVDQDPFSDSATPLKGRNRGFPVMPAENNMRGMLNKPARRGPDRMRPRGGPSITEWEAVLLGKQLVAEDAEDSEDTFKKSELPRNTRFLPGVMIPRGIIGRLTITLDKDRVVTSLWYC